MINKSIIEKVKGKALLCQKRGGVYYTDFLNPLEMQEAVKSIRELEGLKYQGYGGYEGAERKLLAIYPDDMEEEELIFPIKAMRVTNKFSKLRHPDILGAILGMGLKREKIGDILAWEYQGDVIGYKETIDFLLLFLEKVGKNRVSPMEISFDELELQEKKYSDIKAVVQSLRLDAILSQALGLSRNKASEYIKTGHVKINFLPVENISQLLKEGDEISVRGKGRILFESIEGYNKKDKIKIYLKKMEG